ncbi:ABC transporter permease [Chitinophaga pollutisoli]|uniref:ABC transporter permease n=1 Tax=Chitinophaga pollutisoli TaxID=3133966 RepID=A0ABZ2YK47_9BACT
MWKIQLVTAWRRLKNNKSYAIINIAGLGASLACAILLFLFINYHLRFDNFHPGSDRIYRISSRTTYGGVEGFNTGVPQPLGKALRNDYPYFENVAMRAEVTEPLVTIGEGNDRKKFDARSVFTEPAYFNILHLPMVSGTPASALGEPYGAIITEETAARFFPGQHAVGKQFTTANGVYTVKAIAKNIPKNSDHRFDIFLSYSTFKDYNAFLASDSIWGGISSSIQCFIKLKPGVNARLPANALPEVIAKNNPEDRGLMFFIMLPLRDLHFDTRFSGTIQKKYLWSLGWMGAFLVFTACINFINLSTAQSLSRSREIGVRKALGSTRWQIFGQFLSETFLLVAAAVITASVIVSLSLPQLNKTLFTDIPLNSQTIILLAGVAIILLLAVMLLAGYYPGVKQARLNPVKGMRAQTRPQGNKGVSIRKTLIVLQFAIMQVMIVGALVISRQMHFSMNTDGYLHKNGILLLRIPEKNASTLHTLRQRITQLAGVETASFCHAAPLSATNMATSMRMDGREKDEDFQVAIKYADDHYLETFGIQLVAGANLPASDTVNGMLVNEMLVKKLNVASAEAIIGQTIRVNNVRTVVRGVFKDFHNRSFHTNLQPLSLHSDIRRFSELAIRINMQQSAALMPAIEKIWSETFPDYLYNHRFLDQDIAAMYEAETLLKQLVEIFALVAVLIGCLGLYGLISFMAEQKKKEIGVRKVLGASVPSVIWLFGREFTIMLVAGFVLSAPLSWWLMNSWLEGFQYRIGVGPGIYGITVALCAAITLLTVGYSSIRAALMNPAVSLKTE